MITPLQLVQVGETIQLDARIALLRERFPKLHFSECNDDDVSPRYRPAFSMDSHHLYLISGASGHCLELTNDHETATGILVAAKVDGE
ncbi:DUF6129 family protein [Propionivibrio sp.]|uniref:DUF6129 family protein n=1 Tax=Propionivibrio sp. TaxID=2212460 RepID=UPI003BF437AB